MTENVDAAIDRLRETVDSAPKDARMFEGYQEFFRVNDVEAVLDALAEARARAMTDEDLALITDPLVKAIQEQRKRADATEAESSVARGMVTQYQTQLAAAEAKLARIADHVEVSYRNGMAPNFDAIFTILKEQSA